MSTKCVFEYCYRDAANYRANEWLLQEGTASPAAEATIRELLIDRTWFVAEKAGVPTLYDRLEHYSGGPTVGDHGWHEFIRLRAATNEEIRELPLFGTLTDLIERFHDAHHRSP